ncbi:MAG: M1 family metallopeptidase [Candidatus Zixiibacteriota bacterium]
MMVSPVPFSRLACLFVSLLPISACPSDTYWQQEVNYVMNVALRSDLRTITGRIDIEYVNNSPDTLHEIFLKAFPNAVQNGSCADKKSRRENDYSFADLKPEQEGKLTLSPATGGFGVRTIRWYQIDNTIITVTPDKPVRPGDTALFSFDFTTVLPSPHAMRMGLFRDVTKAVYWYPQVCVYDRKLGWVNSQYLGWGECYGDFGRFDVTIAAPEDQIIAATGLLLNESDVLPDTLRNALDRNNFVGPKASWPQFSFDTSRTKSWHYVAEKVNDFTFVSSSQFCLDSTGAGSVPIIAHILRAHAATWESAVRLGKEAVATLSELYYPYQWPVLRIVDCYSGMELPMMAQVSGDGPSPGFHIVIYHEIAHQWFMGQVGSNQTDRPFLDEGFTTFAEHDVMEKYLGRDGNVDNYRNWYQRAFAPHDEDRNLRGFRPLLLLMKQGYDKPMVFSYDQGEEYWPYRVSAYYKTAAMLHSLRSILGDSLFYAAMHKYCRDWMFRHPYEDDFATSMETSTGLELNNYLDQWFYGRARLDYSLAGLKSSHHDQTWEHTIKVKNRGRFVSPIDVAVVFEQGDTSYYTIPPEGISFAKPGHILLPTWNQFRRFDETYTFKVRARRKVKRVVVDPFELTMDINRLNNRSGLLPPIELRLDNMKYDRTPINAYALRWRPDIWYDEPNGVQIGLHAHGSFLETEAAFSLDARMGTESGRPMIDYRSRIPFRSSAPQASWLQQIVVSDYRTFLSAGFDIRHKPLYSQDDNETVRTKVGYISVKEDGPSGLDAGLIPYLPDFTWDAGNSHTAALEIAALRTFRYGSIGFSSSGVVGAFRSETANRSWLETLHRGKLTLTRRGRPWLQFGLEYLRVSGEPPLQYLYHLSRARSVDRFAQSQVFRSSGTFPRGWEDNFYLADNRVRGYQDHAVYLMQATGASLEITPPDLLPYQWFKVVPVIGRFLSQTDQTFFIDGSLINMPKIETWHQSGVSIGSIDDKWYMSGGLSVSTPPVWSNHHIRLDFPLYLNKPKPGEQEFDFRFSVAWILPLN